LFLIEGKGATTGLWFWESREREIMEVSVQGRLVWLQEVDDGEMGDSTKRGSWPVGFG
jgi:hypothetical protein